MPIESGDAENNTKKPLEEIAAEAEGGCREAVAALQKLMREFVDAAAANSDKEPFEDLESL